MLKRLLFLHSYQGLVIVKLFPKQTIELKQFGSEFVQSLLDSFELDPILLIFLLDLSLVLLSHFLGLFPRFPYLLQLQ